MESSYQLYKTSIFCDLITIVDYSIYVGQDAPRGRHAPQVRGASCPQHAWSTQMSIPALILIIAHFHKSEWSSIDYY